jgi:D-3-phosphoglycerate dehydrogenase
MSQQPVRGDRPALLAAVRDADAQLVRSATKVDAEVLTAATRLKVAGIVGLGKIG